MEIITVKRNGILISYPSLIMNDGRVKRDVIRGSRIIDDTNHSDAKKNCKPNTLRVPKPMLNVRREKSLVKIRVEKMCMSCGCPCWRNDVNYCWDCYKYQNFESK